MSKITLPCALHEINGNEIIDYLNEQRKSDDNLFDDTMLCGEFVFESQKLENRNDVLTYVLNGHTFWNNWSRNEEVSFSICITPDRVWSGFDEPVEGDGTDNIVNNLLKEWLLTHKFSKTEDKLYINLMQDIQDDMVLIYEPDPQTTPAVIDEIIEKLQKAKSYIK